MRARTRAFAATRSSQDLGVIAYLAAPLALPDGCVIGALCGIDRRPRDWTAAEKGALQDLSGAVEAEMAAGLRLREAGPAGAVLRESEARYRALFEAIDTGFCIIEVKFDERTAADRLPIRRGQPGLRGPDRPGRRGGQMDARARAGP